MSTIRGLTRAAVLRAARALTTNKEAARALPDSKGGETPKQLQAYRTEIYTYFTRANGETELLYSAENWVRIKLTLETAGPVAVGTSANLSPVLSGRGRLLDTNTEFEAYVPKGTRVSIVSETVNRVSVTVEPVPWLEQLSNQQNAAASAIVDAISRAATAITGAIAGLRGGAKTTTPTGTTAGDLPVPRPPSPGVIGRARLTQIPAAAPATKFPLVPRKR